MTVRLLLAAITSVAVLAVCLDGFAQPAPGGAAATAAPAAPGTQAPPVVAPPAEPPPPATSEPASPSTGTAAQQQTTHPPPPAGGPSAQPPAGAPYYGTEPPPPPYGAAPPSGQSPSPLYPAFEPAPPPRKRFRKRRANDTVVLMGGISLYNVFGIGIGGNIGFYVTPDTVIEGDVWEGAAVIPSVVSQSAGIRVVQFVSDVFYVRGGPRYRYIEVDDDILGIDFEDHDDFVAQKDAGLGIGVGSRWQWGAFTLGLDFFDVYVPVVAFETNNVAADRITGRVVFEEQAETRRTLDVRFARFEIGASF